MGNLRNHVDKGSTNADVSMLFGNIKVSVLIFCVHNSCLYHFQHFKRRY